MRGPVLVTGAAGFAGSHLIDLLAAGPGTDIVGWHRPGGRTPDRPPVRETTDSTDGPGQSRRRVRWQAVDVLDKSQVHEAIATLRPRIVFHCAGAAHVGRAWTSTEPAFAVNVRGTHHVIEGLRAAGLMDARLFIPGSAMVYAPASTPLTEDAPLRPTSPYGLSKLAQEMLGSGNIEGPQVLVARPFNHFGPRQDPFFAASGFARTIAQIEKGVWEPELSVGNLEARRDLTDVRDTVRAYAMIADSGKPGRPYNVCTGAAIAIRDVLEMLLARARVPVAVRVDPARYRPNDLPILVGDGRRIADELGWRPQIPVERTLDDLLEYWRAQ